MGISSSSFSADLVKRLDFSRFTDKQIMGFFFGRCQICGSNFRVGLHHIVYRSHGGHDGPRLPLCDKCHIGGMHRSAAFREKHEPRLIEIAEVFFSLNTESAGII